MAGCSKTRSKRPRPPRRSRPPLKRDTRTGCIDPGCKFVVRKIPLLESRGGCGINKNFGEAHLSAADGVVAHRPWFKNAFLKMVCERPPRPRFLTNRRFARAPLLTTRGISLKL